MTVLEDTEASVVSDHMSLMAIQVRRATTSVPVCLSSATDSASPCLEARTESPTRAPLRFAADVASERARAHLDPL